VDIDEALARLEIQNVLWRYARAVDRVDAEELLSVYHPDATDRHASFDGPATEFVRDLVTRLAGMGAIGQHHITNISIEMDGNDDARVESYFLSFHPHPGQEEKFGIAAGRYLDHFARRNGEWKIASRQVVMDWTRDDLGGDPWQGVDGRPEQGRSKISLDESYAFFSS
jgi:hypothetical protein